MVLITKTKLRNRTKESEHEKPLDACRSYYKYEESTIYHETQQTVPFLFDYFKYLLKEVQNYEHSELGKKNHPKTCSIRSMRYIYFRLDHKWK